MMYGKGAGSLPTGSAVVSDIMDVASTMMSGSTTPYMYRNAREKLQINGEGEGEYYIRLEVVDRPGVLGKISTVLGNYGVSIASVVQRGKDERVVPLVLITHKVDRKRLDLALEEIKKFDMVEEVASILRVESHSN